MFQHLSLYKLLVLMIGTISTVLVIIFGLMAYHSAADIVIAEVTQNSQTVLEQINSVSEQWINSMELFSVSVATDSQIESALRELKRTHGLEQINAVNTINSRILFYMSSQRDIIRVSLLSPDVELAAYYQTWDSYYIFNSSSLPLKQWEGELRKRGFGILPPVSESVLYEKLPLQNYITFYRKLEFFSDDEDYEKLLLITLPERVLGGLLVARGEANDLYFIVNEHNEPVSYGLHKKEVLDFLEENRDIFSVADQGAGFQDTMFMGERYAVIYSSLNRYALRTIQLKPYGQLTEPLLDLTKGIWIVGIFCLSAALPLIIWFSRKVVQPIHALNHQMQRVGEGNFQVESMPSYTNEIGQLNQHFLQMTREIKQMLERVERISHEKTQMEFLVMQQQINPHFLYNTLDFINWMAIKAHADHISAAVVRLSEFFRLSLSNGVEVLTIDEELQRIRAYMDLQNLILRGRIQYTEEVEPGLKRQHIIRLILQPFIENSVLHGFPDGEQGEICISGWLEEQDIYLQISDNGKGIPEEEQEQLLKKPSSKYGGYGVYNVNKRLQLYYGTEYGVKYLPVRKGTTVLIHISKSKED